VIETRRQVPGLFARKHGVKLGSWDFSVKAALHGAEGRALVNGQIDGEEIVYHDYC